MVKAIFLILKKFCSVFNTSKTLYSLLCGFFYDTKFLISVNLCKWYASSAHYSGTFLVDVHYLKWNFICSSGYTRSGVTALSSGHLFYELRLLVSRIFRNLIRINLCLLPWQHATILDKNVGKEASL